MPEQLRVFFPEKVSCTETGYRIQKEKPKSRSVKKRNIRGEARIVQPKKTERVKPRRWVIFDEGSFLKSD